MWWRVTLVSMLSLVLMGCASVVPKDLQGAADRALTLSEIRQRPQQSLGRTVILGGEILQVTPKAEQTEVEVLERPLGSRDRPQQTDESRGRFVVMMDGFFDPAVYRIGREVTIVGEVRGVITRAIGEVMYTFPVLQGGYLYLWPQRVVYGPIWPDPFWADNWWFRHRHGFSWYRLRH